MDVGAPDDPRNDHLVFSKGHASPLYYALLKAAGGITDDELLTFRRSTQLDREVSRSAELGDRRVRVVEGLAVLAGLVLDRVDAPALAGAGQHDGLAGVTSNPTIFQGAIAESDDYSEQLQLQRARRGAPLAGELADRQTAR